MHANRRITGNLVVLLLSSAVLSTLCLCFAFGVHEWSIFQGYLLHPSLFILNWFPILLLQTALYCCFNRHWPAFLISTAVFLCASLGNYFKLKFRDEPFVFSDIGSIHAGLSVAGNYGLDLNKRMMLAIVLLAAVTLCLFFLRKRDPVKSSARIAILLVVLASVFPLWHFVYSDGDLYIRLAEKNLIWETWDSRQYFVATGFPYPFLHSITESRDIPPSNYDADQAKQLLQQFEDQAISEKKKANILVLQLESFTDLEKMGVSGISSDVYSSLRVLEKETIHGILVPNVIGGGTIDTERCFLTGSYGLQSYWKDTPSYVRYLNSQGYTTSFGHPNREFFYNRKNISDYLGFEESFFLENYYQDVTQGEWRCDRSFVPDVFTQFQESLRGESPIFSFRVTLQGHAPYHDTAYDDDGHFWQNEAASEHTNYIINNYLSMIAETQKLVLDGLKELNTNPEPCIVLIFGDHNPRLDDGTVYDDLGLSFDMQTEKGVLDYYGTPWMIWANEAAQIVFGKRFQGEGPTVSPGYLMNVLFKTLGWPGPAFMQFTAEIQKTLPVVTTNGIYFENGRLTMNPDDTGKKLLHDYECAQFYLRDSLA